MASNIPKCVHESWHPFLKDLFDHESVNELKFDILPKAPFHPLPPFIFRVFEMPLHEIKLVIMGQEPYCEGQAMGYAHAVNHFAKMPRDLMIIAETIENHFPESKTHDPYWRYLEHWRKQGVFLLNAALTVEQNKKGSHVKYWKYFTNKVVQVIAEQVAPTWMLWGNKTSELCIPIIDEVKKSKPDGNIVYKAPHPVAHLYNGGIGRKFTDIHDFQIINRILNIKW